ncbi:MAG: hypothetical protein LC118_14905, partial [Dehalococcoidia bacterium]|nr:hypothetical protein [Dehalococcoidia bacterium]
TGIATTPDQIIAERDANGPFRSLYDLLTRTCIGREQVESLIRAGTLDEFGLPRRELLWQLGLLTHEPPTGVPGSKRASKPVQPTLPLPVEQDMAVLPGLRRWQSMAWDFDRLGLSDRHPMALVRPLLHEGLITSRHLGGIMNPNRLPQGMVVEMAGLVVTRQRPVTASGVMFMLLEDEFGLANVVVYLQLQEKQRELVRTAPFVIVKGRVDNGNSGLPNIIATSFRACPLPGLIEAPDAHNFG